ncbi:MAG: cadherin domain-containing protein [Allosphingosinicella sp.]
MPTYGKRGLELSVNTAGTSFQNFSRVATFADGGFVVVWETLDTAADGSNGAIKAQRFDSAGNKAGGEFLVNSSFASGQTLPAVTSFADGSFAVAWTTNDALQDGNGRAIKARLFSASGAPMGAEFLVNTTVAGNQLAPNMATLSNGNFLISWDDGFTGDVQARLFAANGTALGADFRLNTSLEGTQNSNDVTALAGGGFVATWRSTNNADDGSGESVKGQVFDSSGAKVGGEFLVNTNKFGNQNDPSVAALAGGGFVVTWVTSWGEDGSGSAVKAQAFSASGAKVGAEFLVNSAGFSGQEQPVVTALPDGGFLIAWMTMDTSQDGSGFALKAQAFDSSGARQGTEMLVNTQVSGDQSVADIATLSDGRVIVTWTDTYAEGPANWGIKAQILGPGDPPPPPPANWAPVITSNGGGPSATLTVAENVLLATHVTAQDPDGQAVTSAIVGGADAARFTISAQSGILNFVTKPDFEAPGDADGNNLYEIVVTASDGSLSDTQSLSIWVANVDEAVAFTSSNNIFRPENFNAPFMVTAAQPQNPAATITYRIVGGADSARFTLNGATGALTLSSSPDYEAPGDAGGDNSYDVTIEATDGVTTATQWIMFHIYDVNESPVITSGGGGATFALSMPENRTQIMSVAASDPETPALVYAIVGGADAARLAIDSATGALSFVAAPNFEAPQDSDGNNIYVVTVSASDGARSATQTLFVTVTGEDEPVELLSYGGAGTASLAMVEGGFPVGRVVASDPEGAAIAYAIAGGADAALFTVDPVTGELRFAFAARPDFEAPADFDGDNVYEVAVSASAGAAGAVQAFAVTILNRNDGIVITSNGGDTSAALTFEEGVSQVTTVVAYDPDGATPVYSITGGNDAARFTIDSATGVLSFIEPPDYETRLDAHDSNIYEVIVTASDGELSSSQFLSVLITNVNEAVTITSGGGAETVAVTVDEDRAAVASVSAVDADATPVFYSIAGGADAAFFAIDPLTGALRIAGVDYEAHGDSDGDNVYEVIVAADDGWLSDTQAYFVTLADVDEPLFFTSYARDFYVSLAAGENSLEAATVTAEDPEQAAIVYAIVDSHDGASFTIDAQTGVLRFVTAPDYEAPADLDGDNVYTVLVSATDGNFFDYQTISIAVGNVDEPVEILSYAGAASVALTVTEGNVSVGTVEADDAEDMTVTYAITGGADAALFRVDPYSGALAFNYGLYPDFEAPADAGGDNVYDVVVTASSSTSSADQAFAITIANRNEGLWITSNGGGDANLTMNEGDRGVTTVVAYDMDGDVPTYSIVGGADSALFAIDAATGALTFIAAPDYEAPNSGAGTNLYTVEVGASDGEYMGRQTIRIGVNNVNEGVTITSGGGAAAIAVTANENGVAVTNIAASDVDGDALIWSIAGGADSSRFTIDAQTGALRFVQAPNFEAPADVGGNNVYDVVVSVTDGVFTDSQAVAVTVANVNEAVAITSNGGGATAAVTMAENGAAVATVAATDLDGGAVTYAIAGGADSARFTIDAGTGALAFVSAPNFEAPADAGANNVYDVIVSASDGVFTDTQALAVTVSNVNEGVAIISNGGGASAAIAVIENGAAVATVAATDLDGGAVTYAIAGGADSSRFTINATTGALVFIAAPNFEAPGDAGGNNVYDVVVSASDGTFTDTQAIAVTVGNVAEAPVIISGGGGASAAVLVQENSPAVAVVAATDPDGGAVTYSIVGGADAARFAINAQTGALTFVAAPDYELPADSNQDNVYAVTVRASDGLLVDDQALSVTVGNVSDGNSVTGTSGADSISATSTNVALRTSNEEDVVYGRDGHDNIQGMAGDDDLYGEAGNDVLTGGAGADRLTGGLGKDDFTYTSVSDSTVSSRDQILDFSRSQGDKISLSAIDANANVSNNQAFAFIGTAAFSNVAGQLRYETSGGVTIVSGDVNGDGVADLQILVSGSLALVASDFVL